MCKCPCCSNQLLRHARHNQVYWFCPSCRQEMPNLSALVTARHPLTQPLQGLAVATLSS